MSSAPVLPESVVFKFQNQLLARLGPVPLPPVIAHMPEIRDVSPRPVLDITPVPPANRDTHGLFQAELSFDYAGQRGFWVGTQIRVMVGHGSQARMLVRDLPGERKAWEALDAWGLSVHGQNMLGFEPPQPQQRFFPLARGRF
jgi:hypothetical protein